MKIIENLKLKRPVLLEDIANEWLTYRKVSVKSTTYYRYKYIINKYILPYFASKNIYYLESYSINMYINYISSQFSAKTVNDILIVFKSILKYIQRKFNVDYMLDLIPTPKYEQDEINILKDTEKMRLEKFCISSNDLRTIGIFICLNTGMRIGEICALTWNDIDLENRIFNINKSMQRIYKGKKNTLVEINTPKTKKSIRKIPISSKILSILKELKRLNKYVGEEYFLTGCTEKYIEPRNYQYLFKRCLELCNIPNYNFHVLRHTFATNCIKVGMDIKSLSEILGHANVNITLNKYVHSSYSIQKKFLEKL